MPNEKDYFSDHEYLPIGDGFVRMIAVDVMLDAIAQDQEGALPDWVRRMIHWKLIAFGCGFAVMVDGRGVSGDYLVLEGNWISRPMEPEEKWLEEHTSFLSAIEYEEYRRLA